MLLESPSKKKKFLNSINYFRGIAIIIIVLGHCYELAHWNISSSAEELFYALSLNGSVYFVFISGFLYRHIFYERFNYQKFMVKKSQYVLLPYLFCSILPISAMMFFLDSRYLPSSLDDQPLLAVGWYLITKRASFAYWYVPKAMLLFALSPVINWIIKSDKVSAAILFLLPISIIVHRPINNINAVHSLIYYLPIYLIGIWASANYKRNEKYLKNSKLKIILLLLAVVLGVAQVWIFNHSGNFHKEFWSITVPDLNLLQKIILSFLFLSILDRYEQSDINRLKKTAETSFAIYFIHPIVIQCMYSLMLKLNINFQGNFFTLILTSTFVTLLSMAIALGIKAIFKKNSRYLIGL